LFRSASSPERGGDLTVAGSEKSRSEGKKGGRKKKGKGVRDEYLGLRRRRRGTSSIGKERRVIWGDAGLTEEGNLEGGENRRPVKKPYHGRCWRS